MARNSRGHGLIRSEPVAEQRGTAVHKQYPLQLTPQVRAFPSLLLVTPGWVGLNTHHAPLSTKALGKKQARMGLGALSQEHQDHPETLSAKAPSPKPHFPWADTTVSYSLEIRKWGWGHGRGNTGKGQHEPSLAPTSSSLYPQSLSIICSEHRSDAESLSSLCPTSAWEG